jgi:cell division protein FtsL
MSEVPRTPEALSRTEAPIDAGRWTRLPEWAHPREHERRGLGSLRLAESTILILLALFLLVATVNDVVRQTHVNHRLSADLLTWRTVTNHDYRNLAMEQDQQTHTSRDTICGNVSPGAPGEHVQLCLTIVGSVVSGTRSVSGGYYLPPRSIDIARNRYSCFGATVEARLCALRSPPAGSPPSPPLPTGRP